LADLAIVSTDGTVTSLIGSNGGGVASGAECQGPASYIYAEVQSASTAPAIVGSGAGTAQMEFASGGWPVWQGQFAPYGQELDTQSTANHYKFTGKVRDTESGLDYFGARYFGSSMGRFISPDWAVKSKPVPYAKPGDPQSLRRRKRK
jgi:RHS repeat-associated protein